MVVVCLGPFPIPRIRHSRLADWGLNFCASTLLYLLLLLLTFILAAVVGGAPLPKESLTLKTLFWVVGDGVTTVERY